MKIYFEDGYLEDYKAKKLQAQGKELYIVRAERGFSQCIAGLENLLKYNDKAIVYTNFTGAIDNKYVWNPTLKTPELYIRNASGNWTLITDLTTRELRKSHNLYRLYVAGEFSGNVLN